MTMFPPISGAVLPCFSSQGTEGRRRHDGRRGRRGLVEAGLQGRGRGVQRRRRRQPEPGGAGGGEAAGDGGDLRRRGGRGGRGDGPGQTEAVQGRLGEPFVLEKMKGP